MINIKNPGAEDRRRFLRDLSAAFLAGSSLALTGCDFQLPPYRPGDFVEGTILSVKQEKERGDWLTPPFLYLSVDIKADDKSDYTIVVTGDIDSVQDKFVEGCRVRFPTTRDGCNMFWEGGFVKLDAKDIGQLEVEVIRL